MEKYIPDIYQKSIYTINYEKLKERGIKCILMDLDNTLAPVTIKKSNKKMRTLFLEIKEAGLQVIMFSNSPKKRLQPFLEELGVDGVSSARKPFTKKFLKVLKEYGYNESEVAIIGDQLLTDIVGGNKVGITTILINPLSPKDHFTTKINRMIESRIYDRLREEDLLVKGKYYA